MANCPFNEIPTPVTLSLNPEQTVDGKQDTYRAWRTVSQTLTNVLRWLYDIQTYVCSLGGAAYSQAGTITGNTIVNTATETAFVSAYTFPANSFIVGQSVRIKLYFIYSVITGSQTIDMKVKLGAHIVLDTGITTISVPTTNSGIAVDGDLFIISTGTSGQVEAQGAAQVGVPSSGSSLNLPNTAPFTIDTTVSEPLTVTWTFGTADPGNTVTLRAMRIEVL